MSFRPLHDRILVERIEAEAKTAGGGTLSISTTDGVKVGTASGSATVVKTDIPAKNGLIHVIDSVLLP
jgi:chaperonin GroES